MEVILSDDSSLLGSDFAGLSSTRFVAAMVKICMDRRLVFSL